MHLCIYSLVLKKLISCFYFISGSKENIRAFSHVREVFCESRQLFSNKQKYPIKGNTFETKNTFNGENNRGVVEIVLLIYPKFHPKYQNITKTKTHLQYNIFWD